MTKRMTAGLLALLMCIAMSITAPAAMASESQVTGRWEANPFLVILYIEDRALFDLFIESGATVYNCVARDENGQNLGAGVCADPMPTFPWQ